MSTMRASELNEENKNGHVDGNAKHLAKEVLAIAGVGNRDELLEVPCLIQLDHLTLV